MLHPFRVQYPQGSILSEFLRVEHGLFVVQVKVQVEGVILGTGLAAGRTLEEAEDVARVRALETVLTTYSEEYAMLDDPASSASSQIMAEVPTHQAIAPAPAALPTQPNHPDLMPQGLPQPQREVAIAEPLPAAVPVTKTEPVDRPVEISSPPAKKASPSAPFQSPSSQSPTTQLPESSPLPLLEKVPQTDMKQAGVERAGVEQTGVEQAGVKQATEDHQEDSLPDDRLQPLPSVSPQTEPTLPLVAREEAIAPPPAPMLQTSVVEDVPKIVDLADTIIAATIPAISEPIIPPGTSPKLAAIGTDPIDFSEVIAKSNMELKRLGWSSDQGRNYLLQTYGKRSRQLLSDEELLEFLLYLESLPTPVRA